MEDQCDFEVVELWYIETNKKQNRMQLDYEMDANL